MLESIQSLDQKIFFAVNLGWQSEFFDILMVTLSMKAPWFAFLALWLIYLAYQKDYKTLKIIVICGLLLGFADFTAHTFLKPGFGRMRPCKIFDYVRVVDGCGGLYSFPSNHATNAMLGASLLIGFLKSRWTWLAVVLAGGVGLSRVYLGVHYPLDILAGFFYGSLIAIVYFRFLHLKAMKLFRIEASNQAKEGPEGPER